jgi:uncharacterized protein YjbJ (UPF0337 family)
MAKREPGDSSGEHLIPALGDTWDITFSSCLSTPLIALSTRDAWSRSFEQTGCWRVLQRTKEKNMDKEHVKGAVDKAKGAVKDAVGGLTGNTGLQVEGKIDKAKGTARQAVGDAKDAARDAIDKA